MSNDMMELIAGYDTYAEAGELNATSAMDAPATSWACVVSGVSLVWTAYNGC